MACAGLHHHGMTNNLADGMYITQKHTEVFWHCNALTFKEVSWTGMSQAFRWQEANEKREVNFTERLEKIIILLGALRGVVRGNAWERPSHTFLKFFFKMSLKLF